VGYRRSEYRVFVGTSEGNKQIARPLLRWKVILKWNFKKWDLVGGMYWIDLDQNWDRWRAVVSAVMNLWVP
jgi:hypothetical protein